MRPKELRSGTTKVLIALLLTLVARSSAEATHERVLENFVALPHGANPQANLVEDALGNLYGTTPKGGMYGYGTVFELAPLGNGKWTSTVLYSFHGTPNDGAFPSGGLTLDAAGNLYGATKGGVNFEACDYGCGTIFKLVPLSGGWTETILYAFSGTSDGDLPNGNLVLDHAGNLYGTTQFAGAHQVGTVFELVPGSNGVWALTNLHDFTGGADGAVPQSNLISDSLGNLYGTTEEGGDLNCIPDYEYGCGTVFELTPNGNGTWVETVLHSFTNNDGACPASGVVFDSAGNLYGTTPVGPGFACGEGGCGTVYRLTLNSDGTWTQKIIYNFEGGSDGIEPVAGLILDSAGHLYGTTEWGGGSGSCNGGCGTVFELAPGSKGHWSERVIHRFGQPVSGQTIGLQPVSSLLLDQSGNLYGTAEEGGNQNCDNVNGVEGCGTVFALSPTSDGKWTPSLLYAFNQSAHGARPMAGLVSDGVGNLYGTTQDGGTANYGVAFELQPLPEGGWKKTVIHTFVGDSDGARPGASLIFDASGNLYGTTTNGGSQQCSGNAACGGTIFELSPTVHGWQESVLHRFGNNNNLGLAVPMSGLVFDSTGNLYGTTPEGGNRKNCIYGGCGTVYKLSPIGDGKWRKELLYVFQGGDDGSDPLSTPVFDLAGNLYGTTCGGGTNGAGTVFKLGPTAGGKWKETVLYSFRGSQYRDGSCPLAGVIFDPEGNLYGTTFQGANYTNNCFNGGCGIVFQLAPVGMSAWKEKVLHRFSGNLDGSNPESPLTFDGNGALYGATPNAGTGIGGGAVFKLTRASNGDWTMDVLHNFKFGSEAGSCPVGPLIFDSVGDIYGAASCSGTDGSGTIFELSD